MTADVELSVEERISQLLQHLGIARAHIAASVAGDLHKLLQTREDLIASLTLVSPRGFEPDILSPFESRLLLVSGDRGEIARHALTNMANLPTATHVVLKDYDNVSWSDIAAERTEEVTSAFKAFLERSEKAGRPHEVCLPEGQGEVAGITYEIRGTGLPLILFPLSLSASQWDPLLPWLTQTYATITLGGAYLGMAGYLEERARLGYRSVVRNLFEELHIQADERVLDVGCGSGAHARYLARRTHGANPLVAIDHSPYMIREASNIAQSEGVHDAIEFQEGNAEAIPFPDNSFDVVFSVTVMEEVNADTMLSEMIRVTKPSGRVGVLVRALDMPWHVNLPLSSALKRKLETPGVFAAGISEGGCADMSLYTRFARSGLTQIRMLPQLSTSSSGSPLQSQQSRALSTLSASEAEVWRAAIEQAEGTFFLARPATAPLEPSLDVRTQETVMDQEILFRECLDGREPSHENVRWLGAVHQIPRLYNVIMPLEQEDLSCQRNTTRLSSAVGSRNTGIRGTWPC